jgi:transcription elongation factor Elf1
LRKRKSRKSIVKEADYVFSRYIRMRDGKCVTCGAVANLQCGHLFSRVSYSTRWDEMNAFAQCAACNYRHEYDSVPLTLYFINRFGKEKYESLYTKYKTNVKMTDEEILEVVKEYKEKLRELEGGL